MGFVYCVIYLAATSLLIFSLGWFFPRKWIFENAFPFRSFAFEKEGKCYEKIKIRKWKTKYPDASMVLYKLFPKFCPRKRLENLNTNKIPVLIKECCLAESTHAIACILGFGCIKIWRGIGGVTISLVYFLANVPPIIIQRYNRPRLKNALRLTTGISKIKERETNYEKIEEETAPEYIGETVSA